MSNKITGTGTVKIDGDVLESMDEGKVAWFLRPDLSESRRLQC